MKYKTHIAGGLALGYIAFNNVGLLDVDLVNAKTFVVATSGLIIGSLLPDIDIATSYLSNKVKLLSFFTSKLFKHRGYTHSIVGAVTMSLLIFLILSSLESVSGIAREFSIAASIGIASHIILDLFNITGVDLFHPFYNDRVTLGALSFVRVHRYSVIEFLMTIVFSIIAYKSLGVL